MENSVSSGWENFDLDMARQYLDIFRSGLGCKGLLPCCACMGRQAIPASAFLPALCLHAWRTRESTARESRYHSSPPERLLS
jgi:hypothetical protein